MEFETLKSILTCYLSYNAEKELKTYLNSIGVDTSKTNRKSDLTYLIERNTKNNTHLFLLSRIACISGTDVKKLLKISDRVLSSMTCSGYLKTVFPECPYPLYRAEDVLIMMNYGIPCTIKGLRRKAKNPEHPNLDRIYVTPEELADVRGCSVEQVHRMMETREIASIQTIHESMIPLTQFKRHNYWEVL